MAKATISVWIGRVLSGLISALFTFSAIMKFSGAEELKKEMVKFGIDENLIRPIGIVEAICVLLYVIPQTKVLGAILLTGYLGGAILTHLRINDPFIMHIIFGVLVWLGIYLRDERLRFILPFMEKKKPAESQ